MICLSARMQYAVDVWELERQKRTEYAKIKKFPKTKVG